MSAVATMDMVEALRDEVREEMERLRRKVVELERRVESPVRAPDTSATASGFRPRPLAERLAGLGRIRAVREAILRERGGEPPPSSADDIRQMREERTAQILGEDVD